MTNYGMRYYKIGKTRYTVYIEDGLGEARKQGELIFIAEKKWIFSPNKDLGFTRVVLRRIYNKLYQLEKQDSPHD